MADIKRINELGKFIKQSMFNGSYKQNPAFDEGVLLFISNVLKLLKEQEAVKPIPPEDEFGLYRCGKCYHQLFRCVDKYCSRCGQAVEWNG